MSGSSRVRFSRRRLLLESAAVSSALLANRVVLGDSSERRLEMIAPNDQPRAGLIAQTLSQLSRRRPPPARNAARLTD
jgi:hypothetical protein